MSWKNETSVFLTCPFCEGEASSLSPLISSSFALPMFALACAYPTTEEFRLYYFCMGIFCSSFQMSIINFFTKDLHLTACQYLFIQKIVSFPLILGTVWNFTVPWWLSTLPSVVCILCFSWIPVFPGSKDSRLLAAHHIPYQGGKSMITLQPWKLHYVLLHPPSPTQLLFQAAPVLSQPDHILFLVMLPVFCLHSWTSCCPFWWYSTLWWQDVWPHAHCSPLPCKSCQNRAGSVSEMFHEALDNGGSARWKCCCCCCCPCPHVLSNKGLCVYLVHVSYLG